MQLSIYLSIDSAPPCGEYELLRKPLAKWADCPPGYLFAIVAGACATVACSAANPEYASARAVAEADLQIYSV
jgi:hypothetical protein